MKFAARLEDTGHSKQLSPLDDLISPGEFRNLRAPSLTERLVPIIEPELIKMTGPLSRLHLGKPQQFKNLEIIPLSMPGDHGIDCLTMKEALAAGILTVTPISLEGLQSLQIGKNSRELYRQRTPQTWATAPGFTGNQPDMAVVGPSKRPVPTRNTCQLLPPQGNPGVTEIGQGEFWHLKVANSGEKPVLLLAGEELVGGQQSRALNTTFLLKGNSEALIPVGCTEPDRAFPLDTKISTPEMVVPYQIRMKLSRSVTPSLTRLEGFWADRGSTQNATWDEFRKSPTHTGVDSRTSALADIYQSKADELKEHMEAFGCLPDQNGLLAIINGEVAGFDIVPHKPTYQKLHHSLVKSYALSAILQGYELDSGEFGKVGNTPQKSSFPMPSLGNYPPKNRGWWGKNEAELPQNGFSPDSSCELEMSEVLPSNSRARSFLQRAKTCKERRYESVGCGTVHQFEGETVVGSALICDRRVINISFFNSKERLLPPPGVSK